MTNDRRSFLKRSILLGGSAWLLGGRTTAVRAADDPASDGGAPITCGRYHRIHSRVLQEDRTLLVRLPEGHEAEGRRFPVLYKLDGGKAVFLHACSAADSVTDRHAGVSDHIVVGIENTDRERDMTPGDGADSFIEFMREELIPWIENNFPTSGFRILAGQSASSIFTFHAFLKQPGLFDAYICSSFGLRHAPGVASRLETELKRADLRNVKRTHLFITNGALDRYDPDGSRVRTGLEFLDALRSAAPASVLLKYRVYPDEGHVPFPSIYDGLTWIHSNP